jgi:hypothetical protein
MITVVKGKTVQIDIINVNPGGGAATSITTYEWKINGTVQLNNSTVLSINTNSLNIGNNTISMRILNNCGTWSVPLTETVTVTAPQPVASITILIGKSTLTIGEATTVRATAYTATGAVVPKVPIQWTWTPGDIANIVPNIFTDTDIASTLVALKPGACQIKATTELGIFGTNNITVVGCTPPDCKIQLTQS